MDKYWFKMANYRLIATPPQLPWTLITNEVIDLTI
jgi:hypothetical protein